jgi:predicted component of type VI protein secretion system
MKVVIDLTVTVLVMDHTIVQQTELKIFVVADVTNVETVKWKDRNILPIGDSNMQKVVSVTTVTVNVMVHGDAPQTGRLIFVVVLSLGHVLNAA